jgi:glucosamine 6-phosphate synthetase-like amidotransferase/phosphosugar isomerase protein
MKKTITYKATGLVLGNTWGGGRGTYATVPLQSDSKEELLAEANKLLVEGRLDNGMGFESLVGAVLSVTKQTIIEVEGDEYINEKYEIEVIGTLSEDEIEWVQENVLFNLVY